MALMNEKDYLRDSIMMFYNTPNLGYSQKDLCGNTRLSQAAISRRLLLLRKHKLIFICGIHNRRKKYLPTKLGKQYIKRIFHYRFNKYLFEEYEKRLFEGKETKYVASLLDKTEVEQWNTYAQNANVNTSTKE